MQSAPLITDNYNTTKNTKENTKENTIENTKQITTIDTIGHNRMTQNTQS